MNSDENQSVFINARVLRVHDDELLVCDRNTGQRVLVHIPVVRRFRAGDPLCIEYSGMMTMSIPPQISATGIRWGPCH